MYPNMDIQATKLELIRLISNTRSELLLDRLRHLLVGKPQMQGAEDASVLSEDETALLLKINEGLPASVQKRYHQLMQHSLDRNLGEEAHDELMRLIPQVEAYQAERLSHMIQLAALWNCSVDDLMERLQITPPPLMEPKCDE